MLSPLYPIGVEEIENILPLYPIGVEEIKNITTTNENIERQVDLRCQLAKLSAEGKEIIKLIFNTPKELIELSQSLSQHSLRQFLRKRGWKYCIIESAFYEIKNVLNNL